MADITIPVGNGVVIIDMSLKKELFQGKYIVMRSVGESGPCQDGMCQIIRDLKISLEIPVEDDSLLVFAGEGVFLAMDKSVYRSIDKGRERIKVYKNILGNLAVKGFVYTE